MQRGDIWWADHEPPRGSEPGYARPVLIVQSDPFNRSKIATAVVVAITSSLELAELPGNVRLSKRASRLPRESVANVSQLLTVDRALLRDRVGQLSAATMELVDAGLRLALGL